MVWTRVHVDVELRSQATFGSGNILRNASFILSFCNSQKENCHLGMSPLSIQDISHSPNCAFRSHLLLQFQASFWAPLLGAKCSYADFSLEFCVLPATHLFQEWIV
ncbi:hypothetical protein TNCV_2444591 [Trichonephila clavipes]|nr:hypothetical protein TNCV_2444591 [Trichonephila clavipes]